MSSRIFGALIVAFWLVMMTALIRLEYAGEMVAFETVPLSRIGDKILNHPSPVRLNILQVRDGRTNWLGHCALDVEKLAAFEPVRLATDAERARGYRLRGNVRVNRGALGLPGQLQASANALVGLRGVLREFEARATVGDGSVTVQSRDGAQIEVAIELGEVRERRTFDARDFRGGGLGGALGLPGLAGLTGGATGVRASQPTTRVSYERLTGSFSAQRAYAVEYKLDPQLWVKAWISELGEILRVETPWGVTLLDDQLVPDLASRSP